MIIFELIYALTLIKYIKIISFIDKIITSSIYLFELIMVVIDGISFLVC